MYNVDSEDNKRWVVTDYPHGMMVLCLLFALLVVGLEINRGQLDWLGRILMVGVPLFAITILKKRRTEFDRESGEINHFEGNVYLKQRNVIPMADAALAIETGSGQYKHTGCLCVDSEGTRIVMVGADVMPGHHKRLKALREQMAMYINHHNRGN
ncbi:hypothetical protein [Thaumasiovibrio subtropicus]|uniref:hypothetical protein n=1 Tax=Thaumasiovibrio subtropicus TaxID=1891207 RepID=UPI000B355364|nr:hypothetical protein [Thaumasiovibrio subtropicus]